MAYIAVTKASVRPLGGAIVRRFDAGGKVYAGDVVYLASDGDVEEVSAGVIGKAWPVGIVVGCPEGATSATSGDAVDVVTNGPVTGYASMTPGALHYAGDSAGRLSDAAGTKSAIVGFAEAAATIFVRPEIISLS